MMEMLTTQKSSNETLSAFLLRCQKRARIGQVVASGGATRWLRTDARKDGDAWARICSKCDGPVVDCNNCASV